MAEPTNTPMPPSTPVPASTPRATSPAPPLPNLTFPTTGIANTMPLQSSPGSKRPVVLHIGDPIKYNPSTYEAFSAAFEVIRPSAAERERLEFIRALREKRWGNFHAIFRPFWGTGGEMGKWDAELIDLLPESVRIFASAGAGFDWADTKRFGEKGILYCNSGLAAAEAVADFAVAMIISTFRVLPWCMNAALLPHFSASTPDAEKTFQDCHKLATAASRNPRSHILGFIGLGNIGQQIAAKLGNPSFGMRIHYYDVIRKSPTVEDELRATFHPTVEALLRTSDCVVLCTPASPDGKPLVTASTLSHFKRGSRFVNVARGSLVDEDALADALESGVLESAALDVHADEPRINSRLLRMAGLDAPGRPCRVMLTCHNAGGTVDTHIGFEELSMRNIMAVLQGGKAITPVNTHWLKPKI